MDKPAYQNFIDGASVEATDGGAHDLVDSVTGQAHARVTSVQSFAEEKEAVERAHYVEFGLASSVWTKAHARAMRVWAHLDFGCVGINTHIPLVAEMPLGGLKAFGLRDYTRVKHVMSSVSAT